ncbi:MAG TPA: ABC transporter ATP-binding protein [Trueperaceae bacterium]
MTFQHVDKHFGAVKAVDGVSFETQEGEFVCLLGPSGCGKTTTLRLVAGLEQPSSGRILIGGKDVTNAPPKERDIGMVFQDYALYPHMTIAENIAYPLKVRGMGRQERLARAADVAGNLQIGGLLERRPGQISGGQQQRTSVARAVVHKPHVFLFDEPLSNLDAKLRLEARSFLKHLQNELGVTTIYVTHDQAEAMALADRIALMQGGKIVQLDAPLEVYRRPATTFVAGFLGSPPMNLLRVRLARSADGVRLEGDSFGLAVPTAMQELVEGLPSGAPLTLGIRPEHLTLDADACGLEGEVYAVEPLGPETLVTIAVDGHFVTARIFSDTPPDVQGHARLRFDPAWLHLFDDSGRRLEARP